MPHANVVLSLLQEQLVKILSTPEGVLRDLQRPALSVCVVRLGGIHRDEYRRYYFSDSFRLSHEKVNTAYRRSIKFTAGAVGKDTQHPGGCAVRPAAVCTQRMRSDAANSYFQDLPNDLPLEPHFLDLFIGK